MALEYLFTIKDNGTATIKKVEQNVLNLQQNLVKVDSKVNILNKSLSAVGATFAGLATVGISAATSAIKNMASEMVASYDSATKLSDNIGVAADSIMGLRHAAELSNVGAAEMDKNMVKLSKTISDAASGSKQASSTFAKMGIDIKNADGSVKNSEQVLMEMADAFQKLPAGAQRATLAMDVFGKSGASMVTMLKDGSGSLKEMADAGKASAGNIENISKIMGELSDAGTQAKAAITGFLASLADNGLVVAAVQGLKDLNKEFLEWRKISAENKDKEKKQGLEDLTDATKKYYAKLADVQHIQKQLDSMDSGDSAFKKKAKELKEAEKEAGKLSDTVGKLNGTKLELSFFGNVKNKVDETAALKAELKGLNEAYSNLKGKRDTSDIEARIAAIKSEMGYNKENNEALEKKKKLAQETAQAIANYKDPDDADKKRLKAAEELRKLAEQHVKERERAIESLAGMEEKFTLASLKGEEQKAAQISSTYKKYGKELEELQKKELLLVKAGSEEEIKIRTEQAARIQMIENARSREMEEARQQAATKLADYQVNATIASLEGEEQKYAQIQANLEKEMQGLEAMHEAELFYAEDKYATLMEQEQRLLELRQRYSNQEIAVYEEFSKKRLAEQQKLTDMQLSAAATSVGAIQQITEGQRAYFGVFKAAAMAEATINAYQSILRTMASYPWPASGIIATLQGAAAAVQVKKISATKMASGGMVSGRNRFAWLNEDGQEAILNPRGVRSAGGAAGVNALNSGDTINNHYSNDSRQTSTTVVVSSLITSRQDMDKLTQIMGNIQRKR